MDKLTGYRKILMTLLEQNAAYYKGTTNPRTLQLLFDPLQDQFLLLMMGWEGDDYTHQCLAHLGIANEKVWIYQNTMDFSIEEELVKKGIPASGIVLGIKHPDYQKYTDFALA
jgi:hypothetical protein